MLGQEGRNCHAIGRPKRSVSDSSPRSHLTLFIGTLRDEAELAFEVTRTSHPTKVLIKTWRIWTEESVKMFDDDQIRKLAESLNLILGLLILIAVGLGAVVAGIVVVWVFHYRVTWLFHRK